jgi:hypothetical protein
MISSEATYEPMPEHQKYLLFAQITNAIGATIGIIVLGFFMLDLARFSDPGWVYLLLIPMAGLHTIEEYIFPGGFLTWFNTGPFNSQDPTFPLTAKAAFWTDAVAAIINIVLVVLIGRYVLWLMLGLGAIFLINGFWHLTDGITQGRYSPGMATSAVLYVPGISYLFYFYYSQGLVPLYQLALAFVIGLFANTMFFVQIRKTLRRRAG